MPHTSFEPRSSSLNLPIHELKLSKALRMLCVEALEHSGSIHAAAGKLGITRHALKRRMIKYSIDWPRTHGSSEEVIKANGVSPAALPTQSSSTSGIRAFQGHAADQPTSFADSPSTPETARTTNAQGPDAKTPARIVLESFNLNQAERIMCLKALETAGTILDAAQRLGITRHALKRRIIKHEIPWPPSAALRTQVAKEKPEDERAKGLDSLNSLEF